MEHQPTFDSFQALLPTPSFLFPLCSERGILQIKDKFIQYCLKAAQKSPHKRRCFHSVWHSHHCFLLMFIIHVRVKHSKNARNGWVMCCYFVQKKISLYFRKWILFIQQWKCALIRSWVLFFATAWRLRRVWQALIFKWYPQTRSWLQLNRVFGWGLGGWKAEERWREQGKKRRKGKRCRGKRRMTLFWSYIWPLCGCSCLLCEEFYSPAPSWDCSHEGRAGCWWSGIKADEVRLYRFY